MTARFLAAGAAILLVGCSGEVVEMTGGTTGGTGGSGESSSVVTSTAANGVTTTTSGAGGAPVCVPSTGGATVQPTCADLAGLTLTDLSFADEDGDGKLGSGENATVTVNLVELAGTGFNAYPGVTFTSDFADVAANGMAQFYAILPCQSIPASTSVGFAGKVPPGKVVHVKAQVSMLGQSCPDAPSATISFVTE